MNDDSENRWLCSACFKEIYKITDDFDWRKVGIIHMRCDKCGDDPVILFDIEDL